MTRSPAPWLLAAAAALGAPLEATICAADDVPAATLLVPYFEQDLADPEGRSTIVTVANADAAPALANVTLWTDWAIPTLVFQIYLTGYDSQSFILRDVFRGMLPRTADSGSDPADRISHRGFLSQDADFAGSSGPCASPYPALPQPALDAASVERLRRAHRGLSLPGSSLCASENYGDDLARGYITIDVVERCSSLTPDDPRYWSEGVASRRNVLRGRMFYADPSENFAGGEPLVHIEACPPGATGGGCPFEAGAMTFYGAFLGASAADQREPLPAVFAADYILGGAFDAGTDLIVWRDVKRRRSPESCAPSRQRHLEESQVAVFDEEENVHTACIEGDIVIPIGGPSPCFPLAAQRVSVEGGNLVAWDIGPVFDFGWLYLDLAHTTSPDLFPGRAQAWVLASSKAQGRFNVLHRATHLGSGCAAPPPRLPIP